METRNYRDIFCGLILALAGAFVSVYSLSNNTLGTISRMGPGLFPTALGVILSVLGISILITAFFGSLTRSENFLERVDYRAFLSVIGSVVVFAVLVMPFGMVPAVIATVFVSRLAEEKIDVIQPLILGAILSLVVVLVFSFGLGMTFSIIRWPF